MTPFTNPTDPQALLAAMRLGVDYTETISLRSFKVMVRPLSMLETLQVAHEVQVQMSQKDEFSKHRLSENSIVARETLKRATSTDVGSKDSILTDLILEKMTPEEVQYLFKQYVAAVDRKNPCLEMMTAEKVQELVNEVKKNPREEWASLLTGLSFSELLSLSHHLISEG